MAHDYFSISSFITWLLITVYALWIISLVSDLASVFIGMLILLYILFYIEGQIVEWYRKMRSIIDFLNDHERGE